ncbi:uncharacterized protein LOC118749680 [Rhagoletis pomonella]|uniref:uncharacterized protein LOC118749680 n=1 Tax=Rhagoletis pomonella TaxID=28610 RepID=UPI001784A06D|nr:uncharacterized protein LOC118749680 [Rhagoletis pomonella]
MKDFYKHMKYKHGEHTCMTLKCYSKLKQKLAKQMAQLKFLLECRKYNLLPNHLTNAIKKVNINTTSHKLKAQTEKTKQLFLKKILNIEITQTNMNIKTSKTHLHHAQQQLKHSISKIELDSFICKQDCISQRIKKERETIQTSKLQRLKYQQMQKLGIGLNNDWFVNKTDIDFPVETKWLLSLGRKFTLPTTKTSFQPIRMIAEIEQIIQQEKDDRVKEIARCKLSNNIIQFKRNIRHNSAEKFILETFNKTKTFLKSHKDDIILTDADKGNKTVVMYKEDYTEKMNKLLDDKNTYKIVRNDPTNALQRKNNTLVDELYKSKIIDYRGKQQLVCTAAIAPRLYGLPKIHKPDLPLRPICSSINVPCYGLSKYVD